jgi:hypothetical protein
MGIPVFDRELMLLEKGLRKERLRNLSRELMKLEGVMTLERIEPRSVGAVGEASQAGMVSPAVPLCSCCSRVRVRHQTCFAPYFFRTALP